MSASKTIILRNTGTCGYSHREVSGSIQSPCGTYSRQITLRQIILRCGYEGMKINGFIWLRIVPSMGVFVKM